MLPSRVAIGFLAFLSFVPQVRGQLDPATPACPLEAAAAVLLPMSDPDDKGGWVVFEPMSDGFDGPQLDTSKWRTGVAGWPGRPPALFVDHDVEVKDGSLQITMRKEPVGEEDEKLGYHDYTTGAVQSTSSVLYGYFEVRAKAMKSGGSSSFFFSDKDDVNWNEIDVFEMAGGRPGNTRRVYLSVHVFTEDGVKVDRHDTKLAKMKLNVADDFHVYGMDWGPDWIDFYIDGRLQRHVENTSWHIPAYMVLDAETQVEWWGMPRDRDLPSVYTIDYVRAWKKSSTCAPH